MSRVGNNPITIPQGIEATISDANQITIKSSKGTLVEQLPGQLTATLEGDHLIVARHSDKKQDKSLHGLYRALIQNMVIGLSTGYKKGLELVGVGYKASIDNDVLEISVGKSHGIYFLLPKEVRGSIENVRGKGVTIWLESHNKQLIGQVCAKIQAFRKPEPYKGKGIHIVGAPRRRKAGKKASK